MTISRAWNTHGIIVCSPKAASCFPFVKVSIVEFSPLFMISIGLPMVVSSNIGIQLKPSGATVPHRNSGALSGQQNRLML